MRALLKTEGGPVPKRLQGRATLDTVLNEYYGSFDQMLTATHFRRMVVHALTGKLDLFVEEEQAVMSSEPDI